MANSLCKTSVLRIYQEVIEDVLSGVRELFVEEGIDEQVLQELRQTWETKLTASKAVQNEVEEKTKKQEAISNGFPKPITNQQTQQSQPHPVAQTVVETKMVPIQITLPPQPGTEGQRVLTIQVSNSFVKMLVLVIRFVVNTSKVQVCQPGQFYQTMEINM